MNKQTQSILRTAACAMAIGSLAACTSMTAKKPDAIAEVGAASGSQVSGRIEFTRLNGGGVHVAATLAGLTPGEHGFHVHEAGDCSAPDASSAKGHFNPGGKPHGAQHEEHHSGDMPNLVADANGKATYAADLAGVGIGSGDADILGRAVVIHASPDDYKTQPAGNSGKRVGCGMIKAG